MDSSLQKTERDIMAKNAAPKNGDESGLHESKSEFGAERAEDLHETESEYTENLHETESELAERVARELLEGLRRAAWVR